MSLDGTYDEANVFARIVRGELPSAKIYETDTVLAFMDAFPQAQGHCLVISKTSRCRNILEAEPEVLQGLILAVQKVARAVRVALDPDGIMVSQFNGAPSGQTVYHLHFHVIPRWTGVELGRHGGGMADPAELKALAERIAAAL